MWTINRKDKSAVAEHVKQYMEYNNYFYEAKILNTERNCGKWMFEEAIGIG